MFPVLYFLCVMLSSDKTLRQHGFADFLEAGQIGTGYEVAIKAVFLGGVVDVVEDVYHDAVELGVHFLKCPGVAHGVLAHFQCADRHAAGVGRLGGREQQTGLAENVDGGGGGDIWKPL